MLQVLVSIQALILNAKPFFNEPGHASSYRGNEGVKMSAEYNERTFILSLKTMIYTLRTPPKVGLVISFAIFSTICDYSYSVYICQ